MAATASPYGLRPVQLLGGLPFAGAIRTFPLTANAANAFFYGDPVGLVGGNIVGITGSPTTAIGPNTPVGVFMGCEYQDPIRGFVNAQMFPVNGILAGATKVAFKILDWPKAVWRVQANGPITPAQVGLNVPIVGFGTGNTSTGDSLVAVGAAAVTATFAMKIIGFPLMPNSAPGDAFTDLLVIWNQGVHRWENATGQ
jgi:hypothetical protein